MTITAQMVKELRESTGAGMMDAKKALMETGGDMEAAVDWLRTKGLAKAAKKSGRVAAEGLVGVATAAGVIDAGGDDFASEKLPSGRAVFERIHIWPAGAGTDHGRTLAQRAGSV